jgi:hypothetical protein
MQALCSRTRKLSVAYRIHAPAVDEHGGDDVVAAVHVIGDLVHQVSVVHLPGPAPKQSYN